MKFLVPYRRLAAATVVILLLNVGIEATQPRISGAFLDGLQTYAKSPTGPDFHPWTFAFLIIGLWTIRAGNGMVSGTLRTKLSQSVEADIRASVYSALQRHPFSFHDRVNTGELISRATTDISRLQGFWQAMLYTNIEVFVTILLAVVMISTIHWWFGAITVATMIPTAFLVIFFARNLKDKWREVYDRHGEMTTVLQENIQGVRVVKAFAQEQRESNRFYQLQARYVERALRVTDYWAA